CLAHLDAELREMLLRLLERERRLHPRLRRDAADTQARPAEVALLLDAGHLRPELRRADRGGVTAGAAAEDCDVDVHQRGTLVTGGRASSRHEASRRLSQS